MGTAGRVLGARGVGLAGPVGGDGGGTGVTARGSGRLGPGATSDFSVPAATVQGGWAAMAPPRSGWEPVGALRVADLKTAATQGIAEIAQGTPEGAGAAVVAALRQRVWARDAQTTPPIPAGGAFAAYA